MFAIRNDQLSPLRLAGVAFTAVFAAGIAIALVAPDLEIPDGVFTDFRTNVWEPGRALLDGRNPFREDAADGRHGSVYPPAAMLATLPFALLPYTVAAIVWFIALSASVIGALYLCGVRDWRCFALGLGSPPVVAGLAYGNVSLVLVLALAATWVWRDRPWRAGTVLGLVIAGKLVLWPVLVWLLFTGRRHAGAATVAAGALVSLLGWTAVGLRRIDEFHELTRRNASEFVDDGVSVASLAANLGASPGAIGFVVLTASGSALFAAWRRRRDDLACYGWSLAAALFASPIVWGHYYALMLVPLALATPYLSRVWLLPYLTAPLLTHSPPPGGRILDIAAGIGFAILIAWHCSRRDPAARPVQSKSRIVLKARS